MNRIDLKGKSISVIGIARSGVALARVLTRLGAKVLLSDNKTQEQLQNVREELSGLPLEWETGGHTSRVYKNRDLVIISPGVSIHHPLVQEAKAAGVSVISEVEMAYLLAQAPFVAVTGTNGKSTTSTLIHQALTADGRKSYLAGNIGLPLVGEVENIPPQGYIVAEISSFQLEAVDRFQPKVAALLNVTTDHLDRHRDFEEYLWTKANLFARQNEKDFAIFNQDDPCVMQVARKVKSKKLFFSRTGPVPYGAYYSKDSIRLVDNTGDRVAFQWEDVPLRGVHNLENLLATACACMALKISPENLLKGTLLFEPLHYRMAYVDSISGVEFYNDSKGTNPDAVRASLDSFKKPVILIAGGTDKGLDFGPLAEKIRTRAQGAVLIGQSRKKIATELKARSFENVKVIEDMSLTGFKTAIKTAYKMAPEGGVVLLSPSCASFDMFDRAEHRGEMFDKYVGELKREYEKAV